MSEVEPFGPVVEDHEELYRAITVAQWWVAQDERPSSAAFKNPSFSTNIASMIGLAGAVRHLEEVLRVPDGGIVAFQSGNAKSIGFDPRQEIDPANSGNQAHANVYSVGGDSERKKRARKLASEFCTVVKKPTFPLES